HFFGNYSLPLVNGMLSLLFIALSACMVVKAFKLKGCLASAITGGLLAVFPSVTVNFFFMYTSLYYSFALMLACMSAALISEKISPLRLVFAVLLLSLSTGIYQSYFSVGACMVLGVLIIMCQEMINGRAGDRDIIFVIKRAFLYLLYLVISLLSYLLINKLSIKIFNVVLPDYQGMASMGKIDPVYIIQRGVRSYLHLIHLTCENVYNINPTSLIKLCAALLFLTGGICVLGNVTKKGPKKILLVYLPLIFIYPIALFLIFLMVPPETYVQTAMLNSVVFAFILPIAMVEETELKGSFLDREWIRDLSGWITTACGGLIILVYIWYANGNYQVLQYTNYHDIAYYTSMMTQIKSLDGYDDEMPVIILGSVISDTTNEAGGLMEDTFNLYGKAPSNVSVYSANNIFTKYLGFTPEFLWSDEDQERFAHNKEVLNMGCYPKEDSIRIVDDVVVVKLQEADDWLDKDK
nr:glucosyltransferase domain-containing protein [Lachnospiraceae bacterium]